MDDHFEELENNEWTGLDNILSSIQPIENNDPRASIFHKIDLMNLKDDELFSLEHERFSFYIPNVSPPKGTIKYFVFTHQFKPN